MDTFADQRARPFGGVPLAPGTLAEPVTKLDLARDGARAWPEMEPAQEIPGGPLDRRPEPVLLITLIVAEERRQELVLDLVAGRRYASVDKTHDVGIGV